MLAEAKRCSPRCKFFRCAKNALEIRRNVVWCKWLEDECNVADCAFATCVKRKLLPNGICGETVKRKTVETLPEEEIQPVKIRGKALRKIDEKEFF